MSLIKKICNTYNRHTYVYKQYVYPNQNTLFYSVPYNIPVCICCNSYGICFPRFQCSSSIFHLHMLTLYIRNKFLTIRFHMRGVYAKMLPYTSTIHIVYIVILGVKLVKFNRLYKRNI